MKEEPVHMAGKKTTQWDMSQVNKLIKLVIEIF